MPSMSSGTTSKPHRCDKKQRSLCVAIRSFSRVAMDGFAEACAALEVGWKPRCHGDRNLGVVDSDSGVPGALSPGPSTTIAGAVGMLEHARD
jgi:hypothetical protein